MIARLWWKEMRVIWPAWPILFVAGLALQLFLISAGPNPRALLMVPLFWPALYGVVVAAAAFAGERENGTLVLLDTWSVRRRTLWLGKASFALASTFGLGLIMLLLGMASVLGLGRSPVSDVLGLWEILGLFSVLLIETVAWGLLWSALLRNPMVAGMMALASVGAVSSFATGRVEFDFSVGEALPARLVMAAVALAVSRFVVTFGPRAEWSPAFLDQIDPTGRESRPIRVRPANASRVLGWKAAREGRTMAIAGISWAWGSLLLLMQSDGVWARSGAMGNPLLLAGVALGLVAGVGIFGAETAAGSQRFLLHLGVSPGKIWGRTILTWLIGLAAVVIGPVALASVACLVMGSINDWFGLLHALLEMLVKPRSEQAALFVACCAVVLDALAVGMLAGMLFRRRITGGLLAMVACVFIIPPQTVLALYLMVPPWSLLLTPLALLVISRAWAADWLDERPGPGRWLRLLGYVAVPTVIFPLAYITHRAWGLRDPGPVAAAPAVNELLPPGSETATTYEQLWPEIHSLQYQRTITRPPKAGVPTRIWEGIGYLKNSPKVAPPELIERIHQAAEMPPYQPLQASRKGTAFTDDPPLDSIRPVGGFLNSHTLVLLKVSDLPGAWKDILAQYCMVRQLTGAVPTATATNLALTIEKSATLLGIEWAAHPKQDLKTLRVALADLRALAPLPSFVQVVKAEAPILDRTFDLSSEEFEAQSTKAKHRSGSDAILDPWLVFSPWERERARRVVRNVFASLVRGTDPQEVWMQILEISGRPEGRILGIHTPTRALIDFLGTIPDRLDRAKAQRLALVQLIALRVWSLEHGGAEAESLDVLVPGLLDHLPIDPYSTSHQPFLYVKTTGRKILPPRLQGQIANELTNRVEAGRRVLISVGPNHTYEGEIDQTWRSSPPQPPDDLVFPVP